jgi:plasmid stabilization system protein ParE
LTLYRIVSDARVDRDIGAVYAWYENEREGLGAELLAELRATYTRIVDGPLRYQVLRSDIRRAMLRRFPYAVYFAVEADSIIVVAVLHASRNPSAWQRRRE